MEDTADYSANTPAIAIDKLVSDDNSTWVNSVTVTTGDTVYFQVTVTNPGVVDLTNLVVSDDQCTLSGPSGDTNSDSILQPSETWVYTCSLTAVDGGPYTNTASADSDETDPAVEDTADYSANTPAIAIDKLVSDDNSTWVNSVTVTTGDTVYFQVTVTNPGVVDLTNLVVSDDQCTLSGPSGDTNSDSILQPSETWVYTCSLTAVDGGPYTNTASADSDETDPAVEDTADYSANTPAIAIDKLVSDDNSTWVNSVTVTTGDTVYFQVTVTNPGVVDLTNLVVSDDQCTLSGPSGDTNSDSILQPSETWVYTCSLTAVDGGPYTNTASADSDETDPAVEDTADYSANTPAIAIDKLVSDDNSTWVNSVTVTTGDTVYFQVTVTNPGVVDLTNLVVSDDQCTLSGPSGDTNSDSILQPSETWVYTCSLTAVDGGPYTNTASADSDETDPAVEDTADYSANTPAIAIDKLVSDDNSTWVNSVTVTTGDTVYFQVTVTNPGVVDLTNLVVSDDQCTLSGPSGDTNSDSILQPSETWVYTCSLTAVDGGPYTNTASADSDETDPAVEDTADYSANTPAIAIDKLVSDDNSTWVNSVTVTTGDTVYFQVTVTNPGVVDLTNLVVSDDQCTLSGPSGDTNSDSILQPSETWVYTCSLTAVDGGPYTNTASADSDETDPAVEDTADYSANTPAIAIDKLVSDDNSTWVNSVTVTTGDTVYFQVTVTNPGVVDLTNLVVSDDQCTLSGPSGDTNSDSILQPSETWVYTCSLTAVDGGPYTNTASADSDETDPAVEDTADYSANTPAIAIDKLVSDDNSTWVNSVTVTTGDTVYFQVTVTNPGVVDLTNLVVSDDQCTLSGPSGDTNSDSILQPSETWVYTCSLTAVDGGPYTNTASADSDETDPAVEDTADYSALTIGINLEKTPATQTILLGGDATFSLQVTNIGDLPLQNIVLTDPLCDTINGPTGDTGNDGILGLTETWTYQCITNSVSADYVNTADVDGEDASGNPVTDSATAQVYVISPEINIEKTVYAGNSGASGCPGVETVSDVNGTAITYCFVVTNPGDTILDITTFTDALIDAGIDLTDLTLAAGSDAIANGLLDTSETWTYTYATTINGDVIPNTATINAQPVDSGGTAIPGTSEVNDSDTANVDEIVTSILLVKTLTSGSPYSAVGNTLNYSFTVTNTGGTILAGPVSIDDDYIGIFTCGDLTVVGNLDSNFDPGEQVTCTNSYNVVQGDLDTGSVTNTADATVDSVTSNTDSATATATQNPDLTISKLPDSQSVPLNTPFSFTISVTNSGNTVLNNVQVTDNLFAIFGANYTLVGAPAVSTTGLLPANASYNGNTDTNLLDPGQPRSLAAGQTEIITITLQVSSAGTWINTAYAQAVDPGGSGVGPENDSGNVTASTTGTFSIGKRLVSTELGFPVITGNQQVTIGELLTYEVTVTLHDANTFYPDVVIIDQLDHGLAFHSCTSITPSFSLALACDAGNGLPNAEPPVGSPAGEDDGGTLYFYLGDITTPGSPDSTITLTYQAVVLNINDNQSSPTTLLDNLASWGTTNVSDSADPVQIAEPFLDIAKTSNNSVADAGDLISFDIEIWHTAGSSSPAYDVILHDVIPAGLIYTPSTNPNHRLESISGPVPTVTFVGGEVQAYWSVIDWSETSSEVAVVRLWATIDPATPPGTVINNVASAEWSSLPGDETSARSSSNDYSTERWYDPGDPTNVNVYGGITSADVVTVGGIALPDELPQTGFAPNQITELPGRPVEYNDYDEGFWLEIPILGINAQIAGVPFGENGWDTTWLWNQLGYLEGTAFPTWEGNTAVTGHVYLPDGTPGPFVRLGLLRWGNQIILHANGLQYTYEVRSNKIVFPTNTSILEHTDEDWLTLITCSYFNQATNEYRYRIAVKAVLISIDPE